MTFRDDALAGRTAYITGGSSGICYGIAEHFVPCFPLWSFNECAVLCNKSYRKVS